jgi:hypothetical protein
MIIKRIAVDAAAIRNILDCYFAQGALIQEFNKGFSYHSFCDIHIRHRISAPFAQMII